MKRWLAVLLGKNCLGKSVSRDEFWSSGSQYSVDCSRLNQIMSRDRWRAISSFFCIYNPDQDTPGAHTTPYWKVEELFSCFNKRCKANFSPSRFLSRDEQCIKNGHPTGLQHIKLPKKFITVGVQIEAISTTTGVLLACMIDFPGITHFDQTIELIQQLTYSGHVLFMDRLYTAFKLVQAAKTYNTYICGTCRTDRGFPTALVREDLEPGQWMVLHNRGVNAFACKDSSLVQFLSSYHKPTAGVVLRRVKGHAGRIERACPTAAVDFNLGMGGNDCGDMLRSRMTAHCKSKKWWKGLFFYVFDQAIISVFRIWNLMVPTRPLKMRRAIEELICCLVDNPSIFAGEPPPLPPSTATATTSFPPRKKKRTRIHVDRQLPEERFSKDFAHLPRCGNQQNCVLWYHKHPKRKNHARSHFFCSHCNVTLCINAKRNCFYECRQQNYQ